MPSVLDEMTARITGPKQEAARQLTPVGLEPGGPLARVQAPVPFPNDVPAEVIEQELITLDRAIDHLVQARDALRGMVARPEAEQPEPDVKAKEREADRKAAERVTTPETEAIKERIAAISKDAKAKTFVAADADDGEPVPLSRVVEGWVCPTHGDDELKDLTSRRGRKYRACGKCEEFEK